MLEVGGGPAAPPVIVPSGRKTCLLSLRNDTNTPFSFSRRLTPPPPDTSGVEDKVYTEFHVLTEFS